MYVQFDHSKWTDTKTLEKSKERPEVPEEGRLWWAEEGLCGILFGWFPKSQNS